MIDRNDINRLANLPIEGVAERLGLRVSRHKAICPFHPDSHPSLTFNTARNRYRCFVCDAHGGPIDLAMNMLNMKFGEACRWLADNNNVILSQREPAVKQTKPAPPPDLEWLSLLVSRPVLNDEAREFLLEQRRINPRVVEWTGISSISSPQPCWRYGKPFYDAPSLLIPYRDIDGRLLSVQSRYLSKAGDGKQRFKFPKGARCSVYNLPVLRLLKEGEPLFITEGVTDCLAMLSAGHKAIAIPSATLLTNDNKRLLKNLTERLATPFHMFPDRDEPGERLFQQLDDMLGGVRHITRHELPEGCKDFGEMWSVECGMLNVKLLIC